jgi:hypothetical protein
MQRPDPLVQERTTTQIHVLFAAAKRNGHASSTPSALRAGDSAAACHMAEAPARQCPIRFWHRCCEAAAGSGLAEAARARGRLHVGITTCCCPGVCHQGCQVTGCFTACAAATTASASQSADVNCDQRRCDWSRCGAGQSYRAGDWLPATPEAQLRTRPAALR